jgi:hypothetical protein
MGAADDEEEDDDDEATALDSPLSADAVALDATRCATLSEMFALGFMALTRRRAALGSTCWQSLPAPTWLFLLYVF